MPVTLPFPQTRLPFIDPVTKDLSEPWKRFLLALPDIETGTYTPTLTGVANVQASTASVCQYVRIGSVVTVSGEFALDPTAGATLTQLGISLPIPSAFTAARQCGGAAATSAVAGYAGSILADATNDRAEFAMTTGADVANRTYGFSFTYMVL